MSPGEQIGILNILAASLIGLAAWIALRGHDGSSQKRERRRRLHVNRHGRLGDAFITEGTDTLLYYTYSVHGVDYSASQDISALRDRLPAAPPRLVGLVSLKYSTKNPANSILICEEWSGLRAPQDHERSS